MYVTGAVFHGSSQNLDSYTIKKILVVPEAALILINLNIYFSQSINFEIYIQFLDKYYFVSWGNWKENSLMLYIA